MSKNLDNELEFEIYSSIEDYEMDFNEEELSEAIKKISNKPSNFTPEDSSKPNKSYSSSFLSNLYKTLTRKLNNYFF